MEQEPEGIPIAGKWELPPLVATSIDMSALEQQRKLPVTCTVENGTVTLRQGKAYIEMDIRTTSAVLTFIEAIK